MTRTPIYYIVVVMTVVLGVSSCIEPPLHLPGQNLDFVMPQVETEMDVVWDVDV